MPKPAWRLGVLGISVLLIVACREITGAFAGRRLRVVLTNASVAASTVSPPFISVVDSVTVTATGADGRSYVAVQRVGRGQSSAELSFTVPEGTYQLDANVLSTVRASVYRGQGSFDVNGPNWSTILPVRAQMPVLLIAPDTVVLALTDQVKSFKVYNKGLPGLVWQIVDTFPPSASSQCPRPCFHIDTTSKSGVAAGDSTIVSLFVFRTWTNPITLQFSSKGGILPVVFVRR